MLDPWSRASQCLEKMRSSSRCPVPRAHSGNDSDRVQQRADDSRDSGVITVTPRTGSAVHDARVNGQSNINLAAFQDSRFAQQLRDGFWLLRFPRELEQQFRGFHLQQIRTRVRVFFMLWPIMELYRLVDGLLA